MLDITHFVFKHNGNILRVAADRKQTYKVERDVVSRVEASCDFLIEHEGKRYTTRATVRLSLVVSDLAKGQVTTTTEYKHIDIHKALPVEVLSFEEVEYTIHYAYKHNPLPPATLKEKR